MRERHKKVISTDLVLQDGYPIEKLGLTDWEIWHAATFWVSACVYLQLLVLKG